MNLDQVVTAITASLHQYDLKPFFRAPLHDADAVVYRQQIMRDLEDDGLAQAVRRFTGRLHRMRELLQRSNKMYDLPQKERWFLHAVELYCSAVATLDQDLAGAAPRSPGLAGFRGYLAAYIRSEAFLSLQRTATEIAAALAALQYLVIIKDNSLTVRRYEEEADYSKEVSETFAKFRQRAAKDYRVKFSHGSELNHIEAKIFEFVGRLYPREFAALGAFYRARQDFLDPILRRFDRDVQFYLSYLSYIEPLCRAGLDFCYPRVSAAARTVRADNTVDLALASTLVAAGRQVVRNDVLLADGERVFIVSGPNQGGKTTFARTFGQLHFLAALGCKVPGQHARLPLFDDILAHFEREEAADSRRGKLQDELIRVHAILSRATAQSIVILNEIFNSTTLQDATFLARKVLDDIIERDCLCVCVTFLDELAEMSPKMVSLASTVSPDNPADRTFKVMWRPADGRSYAMSIAERYRVTYEDLQHRLRS